MPTYRDQEHLAFSSEAPYRIVVRGVIAESWRERLSGMQLTVCEPPGGRAPVANSLTVLEGTLRDQADLNGLLESLYRLHVTIVSVERLVCLAGRGTDQQEHCQDHD